MSSPSAAERTNPFHLERSDSINTICLTYNNNATLYPGAPVPGNSDDERFTAPLLDDFFDQPFINVGLSSPVEELENAILRCKHMYWATSSEDLSRRQRLVDRLVELRSILYVIKEEQVESTKSQRTTTRIASSSSLPGQLPKEGVGGSTDAAQAPGSGQWGLPSPCSSASLGAGAGSALCSPVESGAGLQACAEDGHTFQLVLSLRRLGRLCEQCCQAIVNPSRKVLECSACGILCHTAPGCRHSLRRRCPASSFDSASVRTPQLPTVSRSRYLTFSQQLNIGALVDRMRLGSESYAGPSLVPPPPPPPHFLTDIGKLWNTLELHHLNNVTSNLVDQRWVCFECNAPLEPLLKRPIDTDPYSAYMKVVTPKVYSSALQYGIDALIKRATSNVTEEGVGIRQTGLIFARPSLQFQVRSLAHRLKDSLQVEPVFTTPDVNSRSNLSWVLPTSLTSASTCLGPVQTWNDVRVLEAVNRMHSSGQRGQIAAPSTDKQQARSGRASASGAPTHTASPPRLCYYTGRYFCRRCHWNDFCMIPAHVFNLGQYKSKPVSRSAFLWLTYSRPRHLFRIPDGWYRYDACARRVFSLRLRLFRVKLYMDKCLQARSCLAKCAVNEPDWLFEQPYTFTMHLVQFVPNGALAQRLARYLDTVDEHIRACPACAAAVPNCCAVCQEGPFRAYEPKIAVCNRCWRPCHRSCLSKPLPSTIPEDFIRANPHLSLNDMSEEDLSDWVEVLFPAISMQCSLCRPSAQ